jgi:hypothetical protein
MIPSSSTGDVDFELPHVGFVNTKIW